MNEASPLAVGDVIADKYELLRQLGDGGMGVVFEAKHRVIGRRFAIKLLRPELAKSPKMLARFRREAEAAGRIESEHVVAVVDFGVSHARPFIVMERLQGEDLRSLLRRERRVEPRRAAGLVRQACAGVAAGHARGIVHRDLKPENLFLTPREDGSEWLRVLDFGVARMEDSDSSVLTTQEGALVGTVTYMAPEQVRNDAVDQRSDVYALGVILYEMLCGRPPHSGKRPHSILYAIMHEDPAPLQTLAPNLPGGLSEVVSRALAKEPSERWQSADELRHALAEFSGESDTAAAFRAPVSRGRRRWVAAAAALAAAGAGYGLLGMSRGPESMEPEIAPVASASMAPAAFGSVQASPGPSSDASVASSSAPAPASAPPPNAGPPATARAPVVSGPASGIPLLRDNPYR